ncbi:hypothetical protein [Tepidibacter formicigenes]|nr:hypothetical protein [Tepidibacter formicigenes]
MSDMKNDINNMKSDINNMKCDINNMKCDINNMKSDIEAIKIQQDEHTQILKALQHSSEIHKAEIDNLTHKVSKLQGQVSSIQADLTTVEVVSANNMASIAMLKHKRFKKPR